MLWDENDKTDDDTKHKILFGFKEYKDICYKKVLRDVK